MMAMKLKTISAEQMEFIYESNRIEGIRRKPTKAEVAEFSRFLQLERPTVAELEHFVSVYQPGAVLRDKPGLDVRVGTYCPPKGGPEIRQQLEELIRYFRIEGPYKAHMIYESIHPFTDGNGRSGRMLWAWHMHHIGYAFELGFLHKFYYQTLSEYRV
jgi:Fic family protein